MREIQAVIDTLRGQLNLNGYADSVESFVKAGDQEIEKLKEESERLEAKLKVAADALKYISTYVRYGDATVMRLAAFAGEALKTIQGKGEGG